jgi:glycyl-tRNA synthetase beta chain
MTTKNLLVELFVEELPPKALKKLGDAFSGVLFEQLKAQGLAGADSAVTAFASPRRQAAHNSPVRVKDEDKAVQQKLMPVSVGLDAAGQATPALLKKLSALGADVSDPVAAVAALKRAPDGKAEALFYDSLVTGAALDSGLQKALDEAIARLPIPKVMSYQLETDCGIPNFLPGWSSVHFVRPAHGLVALHGSTVVPVKALGLSAGNRTQGHRFEAAKSPVVLADADSYAKTLLADGSVIASFNDRRFAIVQQLAQAAERLGPGYEVLMDEALLDEVTALVERPNVLTCGFEEQFLEVPQECLILTMKANQKYFPLVDTYGKLTNKFLVASNISPDDASAVIGGNERVVRPRLADAKFFFDQDRKKTLASRVEGLGKVVYHNKLGTQGERVDRLIKLAVRIAHRLGADAALTERAALLAKADLVTDMVGEFPELQGIMGRYYALADGEPAIVAAAIEEHYRPRFNGDALPQGAVACAVALADKLDVLVGLFGIGQVPTGDKDPFGLRRAALGVLRILLETPLPLSLADLIDDAIAGFSPSLMAHDCRITSAEFFRERLRNLLRDAGHDVAAVDAVLAQNLTRIDEIPLRLAAVKTFAALPEAAALAAANKRIVNILKKSADHAGQVVDPALLQEAAEQDLFAGVEKLAPEIQARLACGDYTGALKMLAGLRQAVDTFFDQVMVNAEDAAIRANRLALLARLAALMNRVADISRLSA